MKLLYGDSVPFPLGYDFLATLGAFMSTASKVVMLDVERRRDAEAAAERAAVRAADDDVLTALHQGIIVAIENGLVPAGPRGTLGADAPPPAAADYARALKEFSARFVQERRGAAKAANDQETAQRKAKDDERQAKMRAELEQFLRATRLPVTSTRVSLTLREGKNELGVVFRNQGEIVTSFVLGTQKHPAWAAPRRVADFGANVQLVVGLKKAFFKGTLSHEKVLLDEWYLGKVDVHPSGAELWLRKKPDQKDSLILRLARTEKGPRAEVEHPEEPGARALPPALSNDDAAQIDKLARAIFDSFGDLLENRETVVRAELDGKDVFKGELCVALVSRLVATFGPVVEEIVARSPSSAELSLKKQHDDGRREEIYLRRDELLKELHPLPAEGRAVFAPLGLEDWLPTMTVRPPKVG